MSHRIVVKVLWVKTNAWTCAFHCRSQPIISACSLVLISTPRGGGEYGVVESVNSRVHVTSCGMSGSFRYGPQDTEQIYISIRERNSS